jgi:hypothetical protein
VASNGGGGRYNGNPNLGKEGEETVMERESATSGQVNVNDDIMMEQTVKPS